MDYGKLAYLKAEELEARLGGKKESGIPSPALYRRSFESASGRVTLLEAPFGSGAAVIVKVSAANGGDVRLYIGGLRAACGKLSGGGSLVLFGAGSGKTEIEFAAFDGGAKEVEAQVLLLVSATALRERESELRMAVTGRTHLISSVKNGDVVAERCNSVYEDRLSLFAGRGVKADVCAAGSDFCIVYSDLLGRLWSVAVGGDMKIVARSFLGDAPENFGITYAGNRVYGFFAEDGKAKYFSHAYPKGTRGFTAEVDYAGKADRVVPVKDSEPMAIALESGGKVYLLKEDAAYRSDAALKATVKGRAQSV